MPTSEAIQIQNQSVESSFDEVWSQIRKETELAAQREPFLVDLFENWVMKYPSFESALSVLLSDKLGSTYFQSAQLQNLFAEALTDAAVRISIQEDLKAILERDPATDNLLTPFLFFKGFHALQSYRFAHLFWNSGRRLLARYIQSRVSEIFAIDIHPAARIGHGIFIDHGSGIVIGETAVLGNDISILHGVTLGGTGKASGDRHPKIGDGVMIGAGATILGNIFVGNGAKIAAGSVVLDEVPAHTTVAGVPAKVVGKPQFLVPAKQMDQLLYLDYSI